MKEVFWKDQQAQKSLNISFFNAKRWKFLVKVDSSFSKIGQVSKLSNLVLFLLFSFFIDSIAILPKIIFVAEYDYLVKIEI